MDRLYSRIAVDISNEKRILRQSTFGELDAPATEGTLCNTPMCVGGHTVNLAGAEGYALANAFGFETAAALIHRASRPDVACPRYDACPDEWMMAYIEERAAEEVKS